MILLTVFEEIGTWIDKYANLNTFIGLIVGIVGLILTVYIYRKQKKNTRSKENADSLSELVEPFIGISIKVDYAFRRMTGYGASEGRIIQSGHFKANYEVETELIVTIQNESPVTIYELEVSYNPNNYTKQYTLIDNRENKLQPLEANKHFEFRLRIMNHYYDVYYQEVDKDIRKIYKVGKDISLLNGSKLNIKYLDSKHKVHFKTEVIG